MKQLVGIEVRHSTGCPKTGQRVTSCKCALSFRATAYDRNINRQRKSTWTNNLAQARGEVVDLRSAIQHKSLADPSSITLREMADEFISKMESGEIRARGGSQYKPSVVRGYRQSLDLHVIADLGAAKITEIQRKDIQGIVDRMQRKGCNASTIRNAVNPLRSIFRHALTRDLVKINPTVGLEMPAVTGRRERIASVGEALSLLAALPEQDQGIWATAFFAGLRLGELRALRWEDVDLGAGIISVVRSRDHLGEIILPKSKAGIRDVPITKTLRPFLVAQKLATQSEWVFPGVIAQSFSPKSVNDRAAKAWEGMDKIGLHECRHTFASLCIAAGIDFKALSVYMGHSSITITIDRYGHLLPGSHEGNAAKLDRLLEGTG